MEDDSVSFTKIFTSIADFFFPRQCLSCGKINPEGEYKNFCEDCSPNAEILLGAKCKRCSEIVGNIGAPDVDQCPKCVDNPPAFNKSLVSASFSGATREMIIELKYHKGIYVTRDIAKLATKTPNLKEFLSGAILVPVPLHTIRKIKRGYNQSELICKALQEAFPKIELRIENILKRTKRTPTQTTLNRERRAKNVQNVFSLKDKEIAKKKFTPNTRFICVDDVMTSGATLSECARALKKAGFKNVDAYAFARRL